MSIGGSNSWPNWYINFPFELNLYSVDGQIPNKFQENWIIKTYVIEQKPISNRQMEWVDPHSLQGV